MKHIYITDEEFARAEKNGICKQTLVTRIKNSKWDKEVAITTPPFRSDLTEWIDKARNNGICYKTFRSRIADLNWDKEKASTFPVTSAKEELFNELFELFCDTNCNAEQELNNILQKYKIGRCKNE